LAHSGGYSWGEEADTIFLLLRALPNGWTARSQPLKRRSMSTRKLTQLGNSLGVIPPKEFAVQLDAARKIMKRRRRVLRQLAR
jgi:hypothetical protein